MVTLPHGAAQTLQKPSAGKLRELLGKQTISVMATDLLKNQSVFYRSNKGLFTFGLRPDVIFFPKQTCMVLFDFSLLVCK